MEHMYSKVLALCICLVSQQYHVFFSDIKFSRQFDYLHILLHSKQKK